MAAEDAKPVNTPALGKGKRVGPAIVPLPRPKGGVARRLLRGKRGKR